MATPLSNILLQRMVVEIGAKSETSLDNSTPNDPFTLTHAIAFAFGSGASQYDLVWHDTRLLAAGASEELDVAGGLTDAFGNTLTFGDSA